MAVRFLFYDVMREGGTEGGRKGGRLTVTVKRSYCRAEFMSLMGVY